MWKHWKSSNKRHVSNNSRGSLRVWHFPQNWSNHLAMLFRTKREKEVVRICFASALNIWQKWFPLGKGLNIQISKLQILLVCIFWKDKVSGLELFCVCSWVFWGVGGRGGGWVKEGVVSISFSCWFWWLANDSCTGEWQKPIKTLWQKYNRVWICYETRDFRVHTGWNTYTSTLNEWFESQLWGHFLLHLTCSKETLYPKKLEQKKPVTKACQNLLVWDFSNLLCFFSVWQQQKQLKAEECHNSFLPALPWPLHEWILHGEAVSALGKTDVTTGHLYQDYCKFC